MERRSPKVSPPLNGYVRAHTLQVLQARGRGATTMTGKLFTVSPPVWDLITVRVRRTGWKDEHIPVCLQPVWVSLALQSQFPRAVGERRAWVRLERPWCGHLDGGPFVSVWILEGGASLPDLGSLSTVGACPRQADGRSSACSY